MSENFDVHPANLPDDELQKQCQTKRTRASGPGGQHRNKVETAVEILHVPTGTTAQASERRSQHENRKVAFQRLRINLAIQVRTDVQREQDVSEAWLTRTRGGKLSVSRKSDDFPGILAEAFDRINVWEHDMASAAQSLGVSTSQLVKLVKLEPKAFQYLNQLRHQAGLHQLK